MLFLFNRTGEDLKLQCDVTVEGNKATDMSLSIVFPNGSFTKLLHTSDRSIIDAAKRRFRSGSANLYSDRLIAGHDFYISKKVTGYNIINAPENCMVEMIPCDVNPSLDRDITRNLAVAIFKQGGCSPTGIRTFDTSDTALTKIDTVSIYDKSESITYEIHFLAIKWVGWFRLKRASYLIVENGTEKKMFKFSCIDSKMKANVRNDWLQPMSDDDTVMLLEAERLEESRRARVKHVQDARKPQKKYQNNRGNKQSYSRNNNRRPPSQGGNNQQKRTPYNNDKKSSSGNYRQSQGNRNKQSYPGSKPYKGSNRPNNGHQSRNNNGYKKKKVY